MAVSIYDFKSHGFVRAGYFLLLSFLFLVPFLSMQLKAETVDQHQETEINYIVDSDQHSYF